MFVITSMPVGGAETLLVNLIRRLNRERFAPELCCLKTLGPLGEVLAQEVPTFAGLLSGKYDLRVLPRLVRLLRQRNVDAVVTVGAGDKMFWGRLAAWLAGVPVICSALHSTGWPDGVGRLNRLLTPLTDAFIGVAAAHGKHLIEGEGFPAHKVHVIANGVDARRFAPRPASEELRAALGLVPGAPVIAVVAALRPEKNHELLLRSLRLVVNEVPTAQLLVVGDGPERPRLEALAGELDLAGAVRFAGTRGDVAELLALADVFALTSHNEANPVSILEAMACGKPVVATRVGSIAETVLDGETGILAPPDSARRVSRHLIHLLRKPELARQMGRRGREAVVAGWSLERMVRGYEDLLCELYAAKARRARAAPASPCGTTGRALAQPAPAKGLCPTTPAR
jgi:glycosyltransferase involved in cell wall biosynthesis